MLSAFQLENNRLTRLEADEIKHLASSVSESELENLAVRHTVLV